jgi:hypothetical protein
MIRLGAGQSFASNPKNKWLGAGPEKVMRLMEASIFDAARVRLSYPTLLFLIVVCP